MLFVLKKLIERTKQKQNIFVVVVDQSITVREKFSVDENSKKNIFKKFCIDVDFELNNDLIYYVDEKTHRSCLFTAIEKEIFRLIHDENVHVEIHRYFVRITDIFYVFRLFKKIRRYIEHCFNCQLIQIKRHRSYDELMSIISSSHLFHIVIMNFIVILFNELNFVFIVTCKFFKKIILIIDKTIYNVNQ